MFASRYRWLSFGKYVEEFIRKFSLKMTTRVWNDLGRNIDVEVNDRGSEMFLTISWFLKKHSHKSSENPISLQSLLQFLLVQLFVTLRMKYARPEAVSKSFFHRPNFTERRKMIMATANCFFTGLLLNFFFCFRIINFSTKCDGFGRKKSLKYTRSSRCLSHTPLQCSLNLIWNIHTHEFFRSPLQPQTRRDKL